MYFVYYLKKIFYLLWELKNPAFFLYLLFHYLRRNVPKHLATRIRNHNQASYSEEDREFIVSTYDGSNQSVHPDFVYFNDIYWLVITPYPYGMEEYENPCVYYGGDLDSLSAISGNPIAMQIKQEIGFHLSDPCIFEYKDILMCGLRENTRNNGVETSYIHIKCMNKNGEWGKAKEIVRSEDDPLLSPAFYVIKSKEAETLYMIHVNRIQNDSNLILTQLDNKLDINDTYTLKCINIPMDYYIWHISISFKDGDKLGDIGDTIYGLFLLRSKVKKRDFKLYFSKMKENIWIIENEVIVPQNIASQQLHPYKSCFIPKSNRILYSYIDKKHRYRMTVVDIKEELIIREKINENNVVRGRNK